MKIKTFSVTAVNQYIGKLLRGDIILANLQVEGEISNFKHHSSGHMYFSLKDDNSRLNCVMFRGQAKLLKFLPEEGMKVVVKGYVSLYERDGQYQLYIQNMEPAGIGALYMAFEQLKERLEGEGLFQESNKKPLPFLPQRIGVITSPTGAAIRDIISVINRRNPNVEIIIYPVLVQGSESKGQIVEAIEYFNQNEWVDVIILGRGGGSIEELWSFNEEMVARSIFSSKIPIISAVGHETDFTISDFVADMRAATPSAAAELAMPSLKDLEYTVLSLEKRNIKAMGDIFRQRENSLNQIASSHVFTKPRHSIDQYKQQVDWLREKMTKEIEKMLLIKRERFQGLANNLLGVSPNSVLNRGFSIVKGKDNHYISSIAKLSKGDQIQIILKDGILKCIVEDIEEGGLEDGN